MAQKPTQAPNNPFACASNAIKMHTTGPCCGSLLAVYSYEVQDEGGKMIFTPLTGNTSAELKFYRWTVVDQFGNTAGGALDLAAPAAAVEVDTTGLSPAGGFKVKFSACQGEAELGYEIYINNISSNPTGNSTPANYENVSFVLKLDSTTDADFVNFPAEGLEIKAGGIVELVNYLDVNTQLTSGLSYVFNLEMKKCWYEPTAEQPAPFDNSVIASLTPEAAYPIALTVEGVQVASALTIETGAAGQYSEVLTVALNAEGVQPSVFFTIKTDIV